MSVLYTAKAETTGGRGGHSKTDDGNLDLELGTPGGSGKGKQTNPEQLFACGYSACFGSALESVAKSEKVDLKEIKVKAEISLHKDDSGYSLSAKLDVSASGVDDKKLQELVNKAHQVCPYSKATRGNVQVTLAVNSQNLQAAA